MKEIKSALLFFGISALFLGFVYPLAITGMAQALFEEKADGSFVVVDGTVRGSRLIGQDFTSLQYFHGRPSANDYDARLSGGSNFGPMNARFLESLRERVDQVRAENGLPACARVPADLVLASGSGLDPYMSVEAALLQVPRIARARGIPEEALRELIEKHKKKDVFGNRFIVNVLELNMALDGLEADTSGTQET